MKIGKSILMSVIAIALIGSASNAIAVQGFYGDKDEKSNKKTREGGSAYTTGIGFRGGWTSGITVKHFIGSTAAVEGILGSRYRGFSLTGLYELHKSNAFKVPDLTWEYGIGGRMGFYNNDYYYRHNHNYADERVMTLGVVGILGLEYMLHEIPFTISLDIMPHFDFIGRGDDFIDGSISVRYILK